jgi:hypothetical protein
MKTAKEMRGFVCVPSNGAVQTLSINAGVFPLSLRGVWLEDSVSFGGRHWITISPFLWGRIASQR